MLRDSDVERSISVDCGNVDDRGRTSVGQISPQNESEVVNQRPTISQSNSTASYLRGTENLNMKKYTTG